MSWAFSKLVAEVLDLHLPLGHSVGDVEYYIEKLKGIKGKILEVACGTGRMLIPLLQAGYDMEGMDHSPEIIEICGIRCKENGFNPILKVADMYSFVEKQKYDAIIMPAGSIRNIDGKAATLKTLELFYQSLKPSGLLLLDLIAPRFVTELGPIKYWRRDPYLWTVQVMLLEYDPLANRTTEFLRYEKWQEGELLITEMHRYCLQHWGLDEFKDLLHEAGFGEIYITADFKDNNIPSSESGDWTFHARRMYENRNLI